MKIAKFLFVILAGIMLVLGPGCEDKTVDPKPENDQTGPPPGSELE